MYSTYDFTFNDYEYGKHQAIVNYGICVKGETNFYWILQEITELECLGLVQMKCILFKYGWVQPCRQYRCPV